MNDDKYWSYIQALEHLKTRLKATDDEISIWTYLGHGDGGIDAFNKSQGNQNDTPHKKRHFTDSPRGAVFLREQIESFQPDDSRRYLTLQQLTTRWGALFKPDELVQEYLATARLEPINAVSRHSEQVIDAGEGALIPDLSLFEMDQVLEIEVEDDLNPKIVDTPRATRRNALTPILEIARDKAADRDNAASVFAALTKLASSGNPPPPLLGIGDGEVKYDANGIVKFYSLKNLGDWLRRKQQK